jgi:putative ABC transport system permease protein
MKRVAAQLTTEFPTTNTEVGATVEPLHDTVVGDTSRALLLLFGAVGMVLLIACANVANLILIRTARRSREFAIRGALGAGRARVMRQVLTESLLIALAGGLAGIALAYWGVAGIRRFAPASLPRVEEVRVDARALGFTLAAVVLTAFAFGMLPALRAARSELSEELRSGTRAIGSQRQHRLRGSFVIAELAFAVILLISAGLLVRSFISVTRSDRGYQSDHVLATTIFVYRWNKTPAARGQFIAQVVDRTARIPGVIAAGATSSLPLDMAIGADQGTFTIPGRSVAVGAEPSARMTSLTPAAFNALGLTLRRGRLFTARDDSSSIPVAIVSEEMARRYWPGEDPIGKPISMGFYSKPGERQIVGVVSDIRQVALDAPTEPTVYVPHAQAPTGAVTIVLRTAIEPRRVARDLKRAVAELNPELPLTSIQTLDDLVATSLTPRRFTLILFASFSFAAVVLAVVGVYGVISQTMTERSKEFGVRLALGAQSRDIVYLATRQGITPVAIGVGLGLLGAGGLTTLLRGMLFSVVPLDLPTYFGVSALMLATALLACYIPARRATRLDPLMALRTE